jgi:16S rRNA (cytosine1402-N4)-methyltransferase
MTASADVSEFIHIPVLSHEVITGLVPVAGGHYLDATVGGGGHSGLILAADPTIRVTAIDQDDQALTAAQAKLAIYGDRVEFHHLNFTDYNPGTVTYDGILADLGVSSAQFDIADRGFSFRHAAPLDMRMDRRQALTAADIVNEWEELKLANLIFNYGEERLSRRIARRIVDRRPFSSTTDLAEAIASAVPRQYRYGRIHPATRTFQALRIAVNQELTVLESWLDQAVDWLKPAGKIAVITFHSLEDRIVKHRFKASSQLRVLTKKPILAQEEELAANPRSRSAKLRIAEKSDATEERRSKYANDPWGQDH